MKKVTILSFAAATIIAGCSAERHNSLTEADRKSVV